ncbi:odorant receptor 2a-like isoform X1 [Microplitis mediator]|uniref:odorant receptor 2a-like isoform X1 n=1 Tax=Microplitis mediator TaxID=375433 RepID=UPI002556F75E|nr:odorant receptor 2a-like isoform X1 [Microplitis mediator]
MTTILPQSFFILTCIGLWRPVDWQGWKCKLYDAYSYFVVVTNFAFSLSQLLDIILVRTSINELTNNMTMLLVMVTACGKILGILCNRNEIIQIIKSLEEKPFKPRDQYEIDIRNKYIHISSVLTRSYCVYLTIGISGILLTRIPEAKLPDVLPFSSWLPYNYSNPKIYLLTAAQQIINSLISTYAQVGFDTLFPGMMMYVSAQTNILQYRFKKVIKALEKINLKNSADQVKNHKDAEKNIITEWVECHIAVLSFSDYVYEIFSKPVFLQYCSSSIMLCGTVYYFSSIPMDYVECISTMVFIIGTILQIFMCCMSAHQLTLQFADLNDAMYNTDWFNLSINAKKSMIIIVLKTFQPVVFMSGYIVTLSIESFKSVMKLSYSIYNVLQ